MDQKLGELGNPGNDEAKGGKVIDQDERKGRRTDDLEYQVVKLTRERSSWRQSLMIGG